LVRDSHDGSGVQNGENGVLSVQTRQMGSYGLEDPCIGEKPTGLSHRRSNIDRRLTKMDGAPNLKKFPAGYLTFDWRQQRGAAPPLVVFALPHGLNNTGWTENAGHSNLLPG